MGSVPLPDAAAVFRTAASILGRHLHRLPDGETGPRSNWIAWQAKVFSTCPDFEPVPQQAGRPSVGQGPHASEEPGVGAPGGAAKPQKTQQRYRLKDGFSVSGPAFGPLGYAVAARASYEVFAAVRGEGGLPEGSRFQVCLPTPLAPVAAFVVSDDQAAVEAAYEAALLAELDEILDAIPHEDLAVQWDVAIEFALLEGVFSSWFGSSEVEILTRLVRVGRRVPDDVPLGYHLCYGDAAHRHFAEPRDTACLTRVANGIEAHLRRNLDWLHVPVPRDRHDAAYFEPLLDFACPETCEVHLGLVHATDGVEGTERRIATARQVLDFDFGVATECGMGRRPPESIPDLLRLHVAVADPWDA